jgi:hypothetical protein
MAAMVELFCDSFAEVPRRIVPDIDDYVNEPWPTLLTKVGPPNGALFMSGFGCRRGFF